MVAGKEASQTTAVKNDGWQWLFVAVLAIGAVLASVWYASLDRPSMTAVEDTDATLVYNGGVWGDWEVTHGLAGGGESVCADGVRLGSLSTNPPWPPYYDRADNEEFVWIGAERFEFRRDNRIGPEVPASKVSVCRAVGGAGTSASLGLQ